MLKLLIAVAVGASAGGLLGRTRSCDDGGCPLTANPKRGALYGGFMGLLVALSAGWVTPFTSGTAAAFDASSPVKEITTVAQFDQDIAAPGKTLVYFYADWCGACRASKPALAAVVKEYSDKAIFRSVNVDNVPELSQRLNVQALPTFIVLERGKELKRIVGVASEEELGEALSGA